ncbi:MAG: type VI secretion system contractile sheath small subunit [Algicola sp.]|nr:type VI secretion system contractile sheath small subunit [Algicola sp.]
MAKESSVAPKERVNITYKAKTGDSSEEVELPNKMLMIGDFTLREEDEELQERDKINVNKNNFNDVMASQKLDLSFSVNNKLPNDGGEEMLVSLEFDNIRSFEPESIVSQVPELAKLMALREALSFLKGPLGNIPAFRKQLDKLLENSDSRAQLMAELGLDKA